MMVSNSIDVNDPSAAGNRRRRDIFSDRRSPQDREAPATDSLLSVTEDGSGRFGPPR